MQPILTNQNGLQANTHLLVSNHLRNWPICENRVGSETIPKEGPS